MSDNHSRLLRIFTENCPERVPHVGQMLEDYAGREEELFRMLALYGPTYEPGRDNAEAVQPSDHYARLMRFFTKYCPEKANSTYIEKALAKYLGREEEMWMLLVKKYGPEDPAAPAADTDYNARMHRFFAHYNPDKIPSIAPLLSKYVGLENELMQALVKQYGPEPDSSFSPLLPLAPPASPPAATTAVPAISSNPPAGPGAELSSDYAARIHRLYARYCPDKIAMIQPRKEEGGRIPPGILP
jgi:hypothetical protein